MDKYIIDEKNGFEYELIGDYYYLTGRRMKAGVLMPSEPPENEELEERPIGVWGQRHCRFIKQNRKSLYGEMFMSGKLGQYLYDIDIEAEEMFSRLVKELAEQEGVTEQLKADNQMLWVQRMNNIWARATEIVNQELIFN